MHPALWQVRAPLNPLFSSGCGGHTHQQQAQAIEWGSPIQPLSALMLLDFGVRVRTGISNMTQAVLNFFRLQCSIVFSNDRNH